MGKRVPFELKLSDYTLNLADVIAKRRGITKETLIQSYLDSNKFREYLHNEGIFWEKYEKHLKEYPDDK